MIRDNPAKRLLDILNEGKEKNQKSNCGAIWSNLLELDGDDGEEVLMSRLGKVMQLPELIVKELKKIEDTEENDYNHWVKQISIAFSQQNLSQNWETFIKFIDQHTITYLKMNKQLLSAQASYQEISADKLIEMREKISQLIQEVRESDLNPEIQSYLLSVLSEIHLAIIEYKITGYLPIVNGIDATVGHAVTNSYFREKVNESNVGKKVWATLQGLSVIITLVTGAPQLPNATGSLLKLLNKL